jgi:hypothetical protein
MMGMKVKMKGSHKLLMRTSQVEVEINCNE